MSNQVNEIIPFDGQFGKVRAMNINGEPWFVAKDVCTCLGYSKPDNAYKHCKYLKTLNPCDLQGLDVMSVSPRGLGIIPESDLYRLVMRSTLPNAEKFQDWVVEEVLPSIRKHGLYMTPATFAEMMRNPKSWYNMFQALIAENKAKEAALKQIEQDKPKVQFYNTVRSADGTITMTEMSKLLQNNKQLRNAGIVMKRDVFIRWLIANGYLTQRREPSQRSIDLGVLTTIEHPYQSDHHGTQFNVYARITGKGQQYFLNKLIKLSNMHEQFEQGNFA